MPEYEAARRTMVENQLRPNRIDDARVIEAMLAVPREAFVPEALKGVAYGDDDLALGGGRRLIEPLALGKLLQAAAVEPSNVVLLIGCDTGYVGAVLARLAPKVHLLLPEGRDVVAVERALAGVERTSVTVQTAAAPLGLPSRAPFDVILLAGAVREVPEPLLSQLSDGGRLAAVVQDGNAGRVMLCRRIGDAIGRTTPFDAWLAEIPELRPEPRFVF